MKVLVVEDEEEIRELIMSMLAFLQGIETRSAEDGVEALHLIEADQPDVVLLDIRLPMLGGIEVCRHVKGDAHSAHPRIVLMSSLPQESGDIIARQCGADGYIVKPFCADDFIERVKNLGHIDR